MKKRIKFNATLRSWEIIGTGMAFVDLPMACDVAVGRLWVTPSKVEAWRKMKERLQTGRIVLRPDLFIKGWDHANGPDQTVKVFRTQDGTIIR